jgi:hypothetical protein
MSYEKSAEDHQKFSREKPSAKSGLRPSGAAPAVYFTTGFGSTSAGFLLSQA